MAISEQDRFDFVNEVGLQAFRLIASRMEELGPLPFTEAFPSLLGAAAVCMANTLRPAVERADSPASAADQLTAVSAKQVRAFLEQAISALR